METVKQQGPSDTTISKALTFWVIASFLLLGVVMCSGDDPEEVAAAVPTAQEKAKGCVDEAWVATRRSVYDLGVEANEFKTINYNIGPYPSLDGTHWFSLQFEYHGVSGEAKSKVNVDDCSLAGASEIQIGGAVVQ